ncbi:flavohemoglobin expression-modulating QEGLA motif protein [Zhouia sp. PK063]|uniref:flavohemoglobin expression-modulating QEGLA motif protein n=1 Tax=Zhouia sp. PK063 TaxID=3373602 RepID=UPI00379BAA2B
MEVTQQYPHIFAIDQSLNSLLEGVELLAYLNPNNIEQEKKKFFSSKYTYEPVFTYSKPKINAFKIQRKLFSQKLELIEDEVIRSLFEDLIYYYSGMVQCISAIGKGDKFYYNSLKIFGTPTDKDVENAKFILHFKDEDSPDSAKKFNAEQAQQYFEEFSKHYNFPLEIVQSTRIASDAMVKNSTKSLLLKKNGKFSANQLKILAHHEIGVHLLTSYNAASQPLHIFSNGFPKNVETQEGLAVFSEYMSGALTLKRLKTLAYRVLAVDSLRRGANFTETFSQLFNDYKLNRDDAFTVSMRVHRGGGFTKDYLYLTGLKKIYNHYHSGNTLNTLLTGKVTLKYAKTIERLQEMKIAIPDIHQNIAYKENSNSNLKIDFILQNLR